MEKLDFRDLNFLPIDFENIVETLKARIQEKLPNRYTDWLASSVGSEILDAIAYEGMLLAFQVNATANECTLATAKTQTSVYRFAKSIGYKPQGPSQSSVTVRFYIPSICANDIIIPKYTKIQGGNITFYTTELAKINIGSTYVDVKAKSGSLSTDSFISIGTARYAYKLSNYPVNAVESVVVNNGTNSTDVEYEQVSFIDIKDSNGYYYTVDYDEDYAASISFGDGTYGINPKKGVPFDVTYVTNGGVSDNVSAFTIDSILDIIYDTAGVVMSVSVTNPQAAVGGSDAETVDETKNNAPSLYRTQSRCVTVQDFEDIVGAYPGVKKLAVIDNKALSDIGIFGVKLAIIPDGSYYLNSAFKNNIMTYLIDEKKIVATQVDIIDPTYVAFDVSCNVKLNSYNQSSTVINNIRAAINDYLYYENREFGGEVSQSAIYSLIRDIDGVNNVYNITIKENCQLYVAENPTYGTNVLSIVDNTNVLNLKYSEDETFTAGCKISILSADGEFITKAKVQSYDKTASTITLSTADGVSDFNITEDSGIVKDCMIYPLIYTDGDFSYGDKEITIKAYSIKTNTDPVTGEYINSYKIYNLLNLSYATIYFGDVVNEEYRIMYVNGDTIYLDRNLEIDVKDDTEITIVNKKYVPVLSSSIVANSTTLELMTYPRFNIGSTIIRKSTVNYATSVVSASKSSSDTDYLSEVMDTSTLASVSKIYLNDYITYTEGTDYTLKDSGRIIIWTQLGLTKISANTVFYIQYIKKTYSEDSTELEHKVTNINGKLIEVSPAIPVALTNGTAFDYESDVFNLLPYEIATTGKVTINVM